MINLDQMEILVEDIMEFNSLSFTEEERQSQAYMEHCKNMVVEESETERKGAKDNVEYLDSLCDTVVVCAQAEDCPNIEPEYKWKCYALVGHAVVEGDRKGYDMFKALYKVNQNNLSKFPTLSEVKDYYGDYWAVDENGDGKLVGPATNWIEGQGRYKGVWARVVKDKEGVDRVVFKDENLKTLKWVGYVDVDLSDCVGE